MKNKLVLYFNNLVSFVDDHSVMLDRVIASFLALCPLLQHYRGPIYNAALSVLVLMVPYLLLRVVPKLHEFRFSKLHVVAVMILYMIYRVIDHGTSITEVGQSGVLIIYFVVVALGCIDVKTMCKAGVIIASIASVMLAVQYFCFYILGFHLQLVPTELLLPSADQWILGAQTGLAGITGRLSDFYRPSAFFLEPSHFYIYSFPYLFILLFGKTDKRFKLVALLISLGLVLCTSGMGIAAMTGAWVLYFALHDEKNNTFSVKNIFRIRNLVVLGVLGACFVLAVIYIHPVRRAVMRVFSTGTGVTAISGRISKALEGLQGMTSAQWIIGVEDTTHGISYNMPGLVAALYRHGLIGMIMSINIYFKSMFKLKLPFSLVSAVILVTSLFSAHTHSTVGMLYYTLILMYGYQTQCRECGRPSWFQNRNSKC